MKPTVDHVIAEGLRSGKYKVVGNAVICMTGRRNDGCPRAIKQWRNSTGYWACSFWVGGRQRALLVHRVLMIARNGLPPTPHMEVNHKNGIRDDNRDENLEWVTTSENALHALRVLKRKIHHPTGEIHPMAKLSETDVLNIRAVLSAQHPRGTKSRLARKYGVSDAMIRRVELRTAWNHI